MIRIDLNCDLGESPDAIREGIDAAILQSVTSVNVACGGHAGDLGTMEATVRAALRHGVAIGAHPGFADRESFGRARVALSPSDTEGLVRDQVRELDRVAAACGATLTHVKPHGGLYHAVMEDEALARALAIGAARVRPGLALVGRAGATAIAVWTSMGFQAIAEGFADRRYEADGALRSRALAGAVLSDPDEAARQAVGLAVDRRVVGSDGTLLRVVAASICVHGDTPGAAAVARAVRERLEAAGVRVANWRDEARGR
jgi:UPF0271 protein